MFIDPSDITFVIPIHLPKLREMENLRFILESMIHTKCKILVIEQSKDQWSYLMNFVEKICIKHNASKKLSYQIYKKSAEFERTSVINYGIKKYVNTKYAWVIDPNFYVNVNEILDYLPDSDFVNTYSFLGKLTKQESDNVIKTKEIQLDVKNCEGLKLKYSKESFIIKKSVFTHIQELPIDDKIGKKLAENLSSSGYIMTSLYKCGMQLYKDPIIKKVQTIIKNKDREKDMAIMVCHFNWCKYSNPSRNLHRFLRQMDVDELPVYGIELSLDENFETKGRKNWIQMKVDYQNICFQKEACLNMLEKYVPKIYKKIAWIDPDLHFTNKNWYYETALKLNRYKLVQMYSEGYGTDRYGRVNRRHPSIMAMYGTVPMDYWFQHPGHPGGAWGAKRDFFKNGGLYPYAIMGGGDTVFVYTLFGHDFSKDVYSSLGICGKKIFKPYYEWKKSMLKYVSPKDISYIDNAFVHEWHGERTNRNYNLRHNILKQIDIFKNVRLNKDGLVELHSIRLKSTYSNILGYFKERDEDGVIGDMEEFLEFRSKQHG